MDGARAQNIIKVAKKFLLRSHGALGGGMDAITYCKKALPKFNRCSTSESFHLQPSRGHDGRPRGGGAKLFGPFIHS